MTGGFNTNVRGVEIDVTKTLNKFLNKNRTEYTRKEFEDYLTSIGLKHNYEIRSDREPINEGFIVTFDHEKDGDEYGFGILATGLTEHQNWVLQTWSPQDLKEIQQFYDPKYLNIEIENQLKNRWGNRLIFADDCGMAVYAIGCEWSRPFFPASQKELNKYEYINYY